MRWVISKEVIRFESPNSVLGNSFCFPIESFNEVVINGEENGECVTVSGAKYSFPLDYPGGSCFFKKLKQLQKMLVERKSTPNH